MLGSNEFSRAMARVRTGKVPDRAHQQPACRWDADGRNQHCPIVEIDMAGIPCGFSGRRRRFIELPSLSTLEHEYTQLVRKLRHLAGLLSLNGAKPGSRQPLSSRVS